ncbi:hypothetical protein PY365_30625 [Roseiarcaceae bacterium H3SJ34-1]|uniref:hypothetical protein n=1 Tax=Terripilifer ovatus TaxID=3032367 RepID=UPI003AB92314|nr:hypothetical protein [Roseiarcaceae bacterium H3SJ34-1]
MGDFQKLAHAIFSALDVAVRCFIRSGEGNACAMTSETCMMSDGQRAPKEAGPSGTLRQMAQDHGSIEWIGLQLTGLNTAFVSIERADHALQARSVFARSNYERKGMKPC